MIPVDNVAGAGSSEVTTLSPLVPIPDLTARAVGAALELAIFVALALGVYLIEYFVAGPVAPFGPSNFWIAFVMLVACNGWTFAASHTVHGGVLGHNIATLDGSPASSLTITIRQLLRFGLLYAIPFLVPKANVVMALVIALLVGVYLKVAPDRRAPWDHLARTRVISGFPSSAKIELPEVHTAADLRLDTKRVGDERRARRLLLGAGLFSVLASLLIVWAIFSEAAEFVLAEEFSWSLLTGIGWFPRR